jgi:membrane-bound lytic murein transglycosylase A
MFRGLHQACEAAVEAKPKDAKEAREFFEKNFRPVRITPLGETAGFLTGYYEPIVDGSLEPIDEYTHPLYRSPPGLLKGGKRLKAANFGRGKAKNAKPPKPSKPEHGAKATTNEKIDAMASGKPTKKSRRSGRKLVSFYDRAAIEDGVLKGRNLEICYLKDPIDSFFIHIQGSARVRLKDGRMMRVNYASQNGHAYYPVGRWLIDQKIYTREEVTMDRIRQWMTANPKEGDELRRRNKSYVFFRETGLSENEEPVGAQGVSLTAGRSLAVDRNLHVYGTPFFIQAELPIESEEPTTKFRRLMIAQDTGGAIIGPARADIYYGAGEEAGLISGRFKQPGQFVMLFPKGVDPFIKLREVPLPKPRPANIPQDETPDLVAVKPGGADRAAAKPEPQKQEARKSDAKPEAKPAPKEAKKPDAKAKAADAKPADAKPTVAAKPNGKKKTERKKSTEAPKPQRTIDPAPPS